MSILPDLSSVSRPELEALVSGLQAKLAAARNRKTTLKVSDKGALSMYGLGRFPVTLYRGQWERLIQAIPEIKAFIEDNSDRLTTKD